MKMAKVISWDEYLELREKNKPFNNFHEQYEVKYEYQKTDGFWTKSEMMFCTCGKNNHDDVKKEFETRFPNAKIISVRYQ